MAHQSDSLEQRTAEPLILAGVSKIVGVELAPRSLRLDGGARVDVDGAIAAGLQTVWVNRSGSPRPEDRADLVEVSTLIDLPAALSAVAPKDD